MSDPGIDADLIEMMKAMHPRLSECQILYAAKDDWYRKFLAWANARRDAAVKAALEKTSDTMLAGRHALAISPDNFSADECRELARLWGFAAKEKDGG